MFRDREDAARQLAARLRGREFRDPLVLAIPRGGVVTGAALAHELGAELDVVLARKLRAPYDPELALGAIGEDGEEYLADFAHGLAGVDKRYLDDERTCQIAEIERRKQRFRAVHPAAEIAGRSVIVTDDGIATGATMIAALHVIRAKQPHELIVAVPVAPPDTLATLAPLCDHIECVIAPVWMGGISGFYADFDQVEEEEALRLLRDYRRPGQAVPDS